ncbi:MAG: ATP-binding protein [Chlamydiales bacterium]|nr:ATP-binding protein [Chlamydiales bacterium]
MLSFRKKVVVSNLIVLLLLIALLAPFVGKTVNNIMRKSFEQRTMALVAELEKTPNFSEMLAILEEQKRLVFHQIALIDPESRILYSAHGNKMMGEYFGPDYEIEHPELIGALQQGRGDSTEYSEEYQEDVSYTAIRFQVDGHVYLLRVGFPYREVRALAIDFEVSFLLLGILILCLYGLMILIVMHRLTRPIQQIVDAISPYQEGREEFLPKIVLSEAMQEDEFGKLAQTLNSLTEKIQKQIEYLTHQKKETEDILESLSEGVIAFDTSAKVTFANQVSCKMLGVEHHKMIGRSLSELALKSSQIEDLAKKCHEAVLQALQTSETIIQTGTLEEGGKIYLNLITAPLAQQSGAILVLQDKTSDYKIVEMGKDFVANASHELRTPITIIRGFAETLQDLPNLSPEMFREITEKIVRTCGRLDRLVKSLLILSDIENLSEDSFQPCDLLSLIEHCKNTLLTVYPDVSVHIQQKGARARAVIDSDLLDLAIMNLLENAVKYSPAPAQIEIFLEAEGNDKARIVVQDHGIGIPEKDLPHVFDRFYTVDKARSRKSGGAGLGLSIVKTIIDKHRGTIDVRSELGKGSCFTIELSRS